MNQMPVNKQYEFNDYTQRITPDTSLNLIQIQSNDFFNIFENSINNLEETLTASPPLLAESHNVNHIPLKINSDNTTRGNIQKTSDKIDLKNKSLISNKKSIDSNKELQAEKIKRMNGLKEIEFDHLLDKAFPGGKLIQRDGDKFTILYKGKPFVSHNDLSKTIIYDGKELKCKLMNENKLAKLKIVVDEYEEIQTQINTLQSEIDILQKEIDDEIKREEDEKIHHHSDSSNQTSLREPEKSKKTDENEEKYNKYLANMKFAGLVGQFVGDFLFNKHRINKRNYDKREKESQDKYDNIKRTELKKEILKEERIHKELDHEAIKRANMQV